MSLSGYLARRLPELSALSDEIGRLYATPGGCAGLRDRQLDALVAEATSDVPFYRSHRGPEFDRLPLISRPALLSSWQDFISDRITPDSAVRTSTSGTSGQRLTTLQDYYRIFRTSALTHHFRKQYGDPVGMRVAYLASAVPEEMARGLRPPALQPMEAYAIEAVAPMSYAGDPAELVRQIERFGPSIVRGDASLLLRLAEHISDPFGVREVVLGGEDVTEAARAAIAEAIGAPAVNAYGLREVGPVARQCGRGEGLHIFEDMVYVEACDPDGRQVAAGQPGELVVTSLWNRSMPILRYRTGDTGAVVSTPCRCGMATSRIVGLAGRAAAVLVAENGRSVNVGPLRAAIEAQDVLQYAIVQVAPSALRIEVGRPDCETAAVQKVATEWRSQLPDLAGLTITVAPLGPPPDGCKRQVFTPLEPARPAGSRQ
jgi:phenylacetate-CoA ligase